MKKSVCYEETGMLWTDEKRCMYISAKRFANNFLNPPTNKNTILKQIKNTIPQLIKNTILKLIKNTIPS
jgi:hypothetical protein